MTRKLTITLEQLPSGEYRAEADIPSFHERWGHGMRSGEYVELDGALRSLAYALIHHRDAMGRINARERRAAEPNARRALPEPKSDWMDDLEWSDE